MRIRILPCFARRVAVRRKEALLAQFKDAAQFGVERDVDLTTPVPMLNKMPDNMPSALTAIFKHQSPYKPSAHPQISIEFMQGNKSFGSLSACLMVKPNRIEIFNMEYKRSVVGSSPYALRHMFAVLRHIKGLVISTGPMTEQKKLKPLAGIGFELIENSSGRLLFIADYPNNEGLPACRAVYDGQRAKVRTEIFRNLGLPPDEVECVEPKVTVLTHMAQRVKTAARNVLQVSG